MTNANSTRGAQTSRSPLNRCVQVLGVPAGRNLGRTRPISATVITYIDIANMPGRMPAANSLPMSCWVMMP